MSITASLNDYKDFFRLFVFVVEAMLLVSWVFKSAAQQGDGSGMLSILRKWNFHRGDIPFRSECRGRIVVMSRLYRIGDVNYCKLAISEQVPRCNNTVNKA